MMHYRHERLYRHSEGWSGTTSGICTSIRALTSERPNCLNIYYMYPIFDWPYLRILSIICCESHHHQVGSSNSPNPTNSSRCKSASSTGPPINSPSPCTRYWFRRRQSYIVISTVPERQRARSKTHTFVAFDALELLCHLNITKSHPTRLCSTRRERGMADCRGLR